MCGCLSSRVEKDSTQNYGGSKNYHYRYRHQDFTRLKIGYIDDTGAGGDTSNNVRGNCDSDHRDSCNDKGSGDSFIGDSGFGHHGSERSLDDNDVDPLWRYYDAENQRRDYGYFIAYRSDGCIGAFLAVRRVDGGTYYEL